MLVTFFELWDPLPSVSLTLESTEFDVDHHLNTLNLYNQAGSRAGRKTNRVIVEIWVYLKGSRDIAEGTKRKWNYNILLLQGESFSYDLGCVMNKIYDQIKEGFNY